MTAPEIVVQQGSGSDLADGASSIDFGSVETTASTEESLTITNSGTAELSGLAVTTGGNHASDFSIAPLTTTSLAPGDSTTVIVTFKPGDAGPRDATLEIASNDADENPFNLTLRGTGIRPPSNRGPEIVVKQGKGAKSNLRDGKSSRNFGSVRLSKKSKAMTFKVRNTGTAKLKKLRIRIKGKARKDFRLTKKPASRTLKPGKTTRFSITFEPRQKGKRRATLIIGSNDADEGTFAVKLRGKARPRK